MIRFAPVAAAVLLIAAPALGQQAAAPAGAAGVVRLPPAEVAIPPKAVVAIPPPKAAVVVPPPKAAVVVPPPKAVVVVPPPKAVVVVPPPKAAVVVPPPKAVVVVPPPKAVVVVPPPKAAVAPALPAPRALPPPPVAVAAATAPVAALPAWAVALLLVIGAAMAGSVGLLVAGGQGRREQAERRKAAGAALALELRARLHAFDGVPVPPNAEAGVSFVSLVQALAGLDFAFRSSQGALHLLPGRLALQVVQHYAAVLRIATFVKGQSLAAAVRMLQANRIGGHPCPDAAAMRDAHVELAGAFQGVDRLMDALERLR